MVFFSDLGFILLIKTTNVLRVVIQMSHEVYFEEQTPTLGLINLFLSEIVPLFSSESSFSLLPMQI